MFTKLASAATVAIAGLALLMPGSAQAAPGKAVLGGGSGFNVDARVRCTLTTIGNDNKGRLVGITAGHCGGPGAKVVAEANTGAGVVGRFAYSNRELDYAVIEFDRAKVEPRNTIGKVTITGVGNPAQFGNLACKEGRSSGNTCGVVYGDVFSTNETWTQIAVTEGDSGAPVVVGTTLVGMVNAYIFARFVGPEVGTNISAVLADMNARKGVGAGYRVI